MPKISRERDQPPGIRGAVITVLFLVFGVNLIAKGVPPLT